MVNNTKDVSDVSNTEPLGYFNALIEEKDLDHVREVMRAHGVHMQLSNQDVGDNWWFFLLPNGTTKARKEHQGDVPHYTIRLPDGFTFPLEQSALNRDGFFTSPPRIFLDVPKEEEHR